MHYASPPVIIPLRRFNERLGMAMGTTVAFNDPWPCGIINGIASLDRHRPATHLPSLQS